MREACGASGQLARAIQPAIDRSILQSGPPDHVESDMAKSLALLRDAKAQVDGNPVLSRTIDVVKVGDRGSDWAIRDFDPSSVELKAAGDGAPRASSQSSPAIPGRSRKR